jgi:hypothetical protein
MKAVKSISYNNNKSELPVNNILHPYKLDMGKMKLAKKGVVVI